MLVVCQMTLMMCKLIVSLPSVTNRRSKSGNSDDSGRNFSFKSVEGPLPEDVQPCRPQMKKISRSGSVLIFYHKQLLKLHIKGDVTVFRKHACRVYL